MYWLITAYDVMDRLELRARCVDDQGDDDGLDPVFTRSSQIALHPSIAGNYSDVLQEIASELNNMAYREVQP